MKDSQRHLLIQIKPDPRETVGATDLHYTACRCTLSLNNNSVSQEAISQGQTASFDHLQAIKCSPCPIWTPSTQLPLGKLLLPGAQNEGDQLTVSKDVTSCIRVDIFFPAWEVVFMGRCLGRWWTLVWCITLPIIRSEQADMVKRVSFQH